MKYFVYLSKLMFLIINLYTCNKYHINTIIFMQFKEKYLLIFLAYYFMYSVNIAE